MTTKLFYKSQRVGRGGRVFTLWKFRTLKEGSDNKEFAGKETYLWYGRFLRKTKLDELPALLNVLKGEMGVFGYRPEEVRVWDTYLPEIKEMLSKHKPGFIDLASLQFFNEEKILQLSNDPADTYWKKIFPVKMALRSFYFENNCFPLKIALGWIAFKKIIGSLWKG
jgi:lipopolysaccharide/colanic/teichoic acid biosynthesis glycosyltransferase